MQLLLRSGFSLSLKLLAALCFPFLDCLRSLFSLLVLWALSNCTYTASLPSSA